MRLVPFVAVLAALAAGCTPYVSVTTATVSGPVIRVERVDAGRIAVGGDRLSAAEARAIAARIDAAAAPQALDVTLVGGSPRTLADVEAVAVRNGVPRRNVSRVTRAGGGSAPGGVVVLTLYVAVPPDCREEVLVGSPGAGAAGCTALVTLARAVADPQSLLGRPDVVLVGGPRRP